MNKTITIESNKGLHKLSRWACESLSTDVQENAATSVVTMMDGSPYAQTLDWGTLSVTFSGGGRIPPHVDDLPMAELVKVHGAGQASMFLPSSVSVTTQATLDGVPAPSGFVYVALNIAAFAALVPCRTETYYEPVITATYETTGPNGEDTLDVFEGNVNRQGGTVYSLIPTTYLALRVAYFPIFEGYITEPVKVSTDNNSGEVSWSFAMICRKDRSGDHA